MEQLAAHACRCTRSAWRRSRPSAQPPLAPDPLPSRGTPAQQWTQCENANCGKWRKLPPGSVVDEDAPWYCYMNPDAKHARCSASEEVRPLLRVAVPVQLGG